MWPTCLGEHKNPGEMSLPRGDEGHGLAENNCFPSDGSTPEMRPHIVRQTR
ncbi:MAG: hypothetical protein ACOYMG_04500 [Candidatus Methylumidiphilus sp.]